MQSRVSWRGSLRCALLLSLAAATLAAAQVIDIYATIDTPLGEELVNKTSLYCPEGWENLCLNSIDWHPMGIMFEIFLLAYAFLGLAIVCDRYLVPALETLCVRWKIRED